MEIDLSTLSPTELLLLSYKITNELKLRGIVRTNNKPIGDYAEWLVAQTLQLQLTDNSAAHYDALDIHGIRYQIKARTEDNINQRIPLSAIRDLSEQNFDFLIAIFFNQEYRVLKCLSVPWYFVRDKAYYVKRTNSHSLYLHPLLDVTHYKDIKDLTELFLEDSDGYRQSLG